MYLIKNILIIQNQINLSNLNLQRIVLNGIASFNSNNFTVSNGYVSLKTSTSNTLDTKYSNYVDYVKERKTNSDGSWYRLWSSGWLEQGGKIVITTSAVKTVSFSKQFKNTDYTINYTNTSSASGTLQQRYASVYNLTTTGFTTYAIKGSGQGSRWYACGIAASY